MEMLSPAKTDLTGEAAKNAQSPTTCHGRHTPCSTLQRGKRNEVKKKNYGAGRCLVQAKSACPGRKP
jgi:hypothetical protein